MSILRPWTARTAALFLFILSAPVFSQEKPSIAEEALTAPTVRFENRTNRRATPQARAYERGIGLRLGTNAITNKTGMVGGIEVFRVFDTDKEKYGADVIVLGEKTNFGHILAIQRVLSAYLEKAFEFKPEQADTVSLFLIYYNAELRARPEILDKSYSTAVLEKIDRPKAGIDRSWKNWAGKTQMIIPLKKNVVRPDKSDVDLQEIKKETEEKKEVKPEEKKELEKIDEQRKKEDEKKLEKKEETLTKKEEQIEKKKEEVVKKQEEVKKDLTDTGKKLEELRKDPSKNKEEIKKEEQKQQDLTRKQEELKKQEEQVKKEQQKTTQEKKEVQEQKQPTPARQEEKKQEEAKKEEPGKKEEQPKKEEVKKEEQARKEEQVATLTKENEELKKEIQKKEEVSQNVAAEKILFMRVQPTPQGHYSNELWYVDTAKDDTLFRSPFTKICSRDFVVVPQQGVLVGGYSGETHEQGDHFLVLLDEQNLEFKKQSNESVFWNTPLVFRDGKVFAVESKDGQYFLSRFNPDLTLDARSSDPMSPHSEITFFKDKVYVTGQDREGKPTTIQVFNRTDLKLLKTITPPK